MTNEQKTKLQRLVDINSWTWNKAGVDKVGEIVLEMLEETDLKWEITEAKEKGNLFFAKSIKWDNSKPSILLSGHLDTVFKDNWKMRYDGDKFYGPGTLDMKAGVLAMIEIILHLHRKGELTNLMILLTPDEEDGFIHLHKQFQYYKQADYAFVFEEGSHVTGGSVRTDQRAMVIGRKALSFFEFEFKGPGGGHQAKFLNKSDRHSAILEMSRFIVDLEELADYDKGTLINTGIVEGGTSANSMADKAYIKVDIRYGNRDEVARVKAGLDIIMKPKDPKLTITNKESLYYPSFDISQGGEDLADLLCDEDFRFDLHKEFRSAGSEANWIADGNQSCVVLDGFGVVGEGDHSQNEYFLMSSFKDSVDLGLQAIRKILD